MKCVLPCYYICLQLHDIETLYLHMIVYEYILEEEYMNMNIFLE